MALLRMPGADFAGLFDFIRCIKNICFDVLGALCAKR